MVKRGPGRPAIYTGEIEQAIVRIIKQHGLTRGRALLALEGVKLVETVTQPRKLSVSLPTLGKLAKRNGIKLYRGRPSQTAYENSAPEGDDLDIEQEEPVQELDDDGEYVEPY
jgi:hypothetical protein